MSDYIFCTSSPRNPGLVQLHASIDDPRLDTHESVQLRRSLGDHVLEWTLPVIDRTLTEAALRKALHPRRDRKARDTYRCDPMAARGEAIKFTTLRPGTTAKNKKRPGLLRRLIRAA